MIPQNLNSFTYSIAATGNVLLKPQDARKTSLVIYNSDASAAVFLVSGTGNAPTPAFPTTATSPLQGKVIPPGAYVTFEKNDGHEFLATVGAGSGLVHVSISSSGH